jgi:tetratricopeptide (TPR) repeat protein
MRKTVFFLILPFLALFSTGLEAQNVGFLVDSANKYYTEGRYSRAITFYKKILNQGIEAPGIYYNLGNAYYKSNQLPEAILNYERARLRDPNNEDIKYNLQLARSQITDKIEEIPEFFITRWIRQLIDVFSSDFWAITSAFTFLLFLLFFSVYLYTGKIGLKKSSFWIALLAVFIAITSFVFASQQKKDIVDSDQAIVFAPKVTVKSSPAQSGTDLFVIHEGTKVFIQDEMGEWYEISLSDGSQGWLRKQSVEPI